MKARLASSPVVRDIEIVQEYATPGQGFIRARLTLRYDDFLEVTEFFRAVHGQIETVEYRYQWMDPKRQALGKRWDNATHYLGLPNFPHHVHDGLTGRWSLDGLSAGLAQEDLAPTALSLTYQVLMASP
jgi:hypothetical protein